MSTSLPCGARNSLLIIANSRLHLVPTSLSFCHEGLGDAASAKVFLDEAISISRRRSQIHCAGPDCERRLRLDGAPLDQCAGCLRTFYCGKACQTADWKREGGHKAECKALIAEAAAAAAAAAHDH